MSGAEAFFVDSNLALYYIDARDREKQSRATDWLDRLWIAGSGRLSWQVLHEFYWNAVRKMRLECADARRIVENLSRWAPVETSLPLIREAWTWMDSAQLNYWDALIVAAAHRSGAVYLLSEDFQDGRTYGGVTVVNPFNRAPAEFRWRDTGRGAFERTH